MKFCSRIYLQLLTFFTLSLQACLPGSVIGFDEGQLDAFDYRNEIQDMIFEFRNERETLEIMSQIEKGKKPDPEKLERLYELVNENRSEMDLFDPPEEFVQIDQDFSSWLDSLFVLLRTYRELYRAEAQGGVGPSASLIQSRLFDYQRALNKVNLSLMELPASSLPGDPNLSP